MKKGGRKEDTSPVGETLHLHNVLCIYVAAAIYVVGVYAYSTYFKFINILLKTVTLIIWTLNTSSAKYCCSCR